MVVSLRLDFPKNSLDDHDRVVEALNFPGDWPDGAIVHSAYEVDGHLVVTDVWESRQHFDRFVEERLRPAMSQALGDRASEPADILERELHHLSSREHGTT
ncbi:MAG TPA: hypothetical protein VE780_14250 [Thermoleophilaceae bacterium]|jgi:hypothetical protein|nr:hypothetical protein [Thermoleophilaceae bacterium]